MAHCLNMNFSLIKKITLNNVQNRRVLVQVEAALATSTLYSELYHGDSRGGVAACPKSFRRACLCLGYKHLGLQGEGEEGEKGGSRNSACKLKNVLRRKTRQRLSLAVNVICKFKNQFQAVK